MAPFFIGLLSVLLGIVSVLIVFIVLMQRPKQEGLGAAFGGGMTDQMFGAQTTNVLQKGTVYLAVLFFVFSLIISILTAKTVSQNTTVVDDLSDKKEETTPETDIPGASGITTPPIQIPSEPAPAPAVIPTPAADPTPIPAADPTLEVEPESTDPEPAEEPAPVETEETEPAE